MKAKLNLEDIAKINMLAINERLTLSTGDTIICIKDNTSDNCTDCFLTFGKKCHRINCFGITRKDNTEVIFKLIDNE